MTISERDRHELHQKLDDVLGPGEAATLMAHLPPTGWIDVSTNQELTALEGRIDTRFAHLDARFAHLDARFESIDARFESIDARFETIDARFETIDARFETIDARLETLSTNLDDLRSHTDARFDLAREHSDVQIAAVNVRIDGIGEKLDKRFAEFQIEMLKTMNDQFRLILFAFVGCLATFASIMVAAVKL